MALQLKDEAEFDTFVAEGPVVIDFWSPSCGPCRMLAPIFDKFAEKHPDIKIVKANVSGNDSLIRLAVRYKIERIPVVLFIKKGGEVSARIDGLADERKLESRLEALLKG